MRKPLNVTLYVRGLSCLDDIEMAHGNIRKFTGGVSSLKTKTIPARAGGCNSL